MTVEGQGNDVSLEKRASSLLSLTPLILLDLTLLRQQVYSLRLFVKNNLLAKRNSS